MTVMGMVRCICNVGWTGPLCEADINECLNEDICESPLICRNTPGSYVCEDPNGESITQSPSSALGTDIGSIFVDSVT